jgi:hypothetical protein
MAALLLLGLTACGGDGGGGSGDGGAPSSSGISINSTSQDSAGNNTAVVPQQPQVANTSYSVLAINDLGMHCGDLDTRVASILPPFQVLLAQVIQKGGSPTLNPANVSLYYSAASNPKDPILGQAGVLNGVMADGGTYKTNFWEVIPLGAYDPFYPALVTPLSAGCGSDAAGHGGRGPAGAER